MGRNRRVLPFEHSFVKTVHIVGTEWGHQRAHFVDNATERPNVRLQIIGLVLPHLRTRVVRRSRLRVEKTLLSHLAHIEITKLRCAIFIQEDVCRFHISMQNAQLMQRLQAFDDLNRDLPDVFLLHVLLLVLAVTNTLEDISIISILHHNTTIVNLGRTYQSELEDSSKKACL
jgi:hypothetical protein